MWNFVKWSVSILQRNNRYKISGTIWVFKTVTLSIAAGMAANKNSMLRSEVQLITKLKEAEGRSGLQLSGHYVIQECNLISEAF